MSRTLINTIVIEASHTNYRKFRLCLRLVWMTPLRLQTAMRNMQPVLEGQGPKGLRFYEKTDNVGNTILERRRNGESRVSGESRVWTGLVFPTKSTERWVVAQVTQKRINSWCQT